MAESVNILIVFHTPSNAGYAMSALERTFYEVALSITEQTSQVYFAFSDLSAGHPKSLPSNFKNVIAIDRDKLNNRRYNIKKKEEVSAFDISVAFCFDLQARGALVKLLRDSGVRYLISYWGSTMSDINSGLRLFLKKTEILLSCNRPDLFIFESESMRLHATNGRGLRQKETTVIPTGVDVERYRPNPNLSSYVHREFGIPLGRKIAIYSGHMEERKGVHVLMECMIKLRKDHDNSNWHMLICGNRLGEEAQFKRMVKNTAAQGHVTFAGYRNNLEQIMSSCDVGVIASTGWDSFPMSALEMASCGLPLVVSRLQGLVESVCENETGILFEAGNSTELANILNDLSGDDRLLMRMSKSARARIEQKYSLSHQRKALRTAILSVLSTA